MNKNDKSQIHPQNANPFFSLIISKKTKSKPAAAFKNFFMTIKSLSKAVRIRNNKNRMTSRNKKIALKKIDLIKNYFLY